MAGTGWPPKKNAARDVYGVLPSQADSTIYKVTPTLASGDFTSSQDGGTFANLGTLPTVTPASNVQVLYPLSAGEWNCDHGGVRSHDVAGAEWFDTYIPLETSTRQIDDLMCATVAMVESYNADGVAPTPAQAFHLLIALLSEFSVSGTTLTFKKLDGSTSAGTLTLDSASAPTSVTRAT